MPGGACEVVILGLFNLGGGEIILILALVLILFGAHKLPDLSRGLGDGLLQFGKAVRQVGDDIDSAASDAGHSIGGIYGKPAAEAITEDNQVAELYDPKVLGEKKRFTLTDRSLRMLLGKFLLCLVAGMVAAVLVMIVCH